LARKDIRTKQKLELRRLRGLPTQQTLAVTRAAAASQPPHTAKIGSHTSCGRELRPLCGLRAQQRLALTQAAAALRPPHTTSSCCHMSCDRFAAYAQNKLSPSHELRPLRSLRTQQALAVTRAATALRLPHTTSSCCHTSCGRFAASAHNKLLMSHELRLLRGLRAQQTLDATRAAAASRPPHTTSSCRHTRCNRFAPSARNKLLLSHKLRPRRGLRTQQSSACPVDTVSWHSNCWVFACMLAFSLNGNTCGFARSKSMSSDALRRFPDFAIRRFVFLASNLILFVSSCFSSCNKALLRTISSIAGS